MEHDQEQKTDAQIAEKQEQDIKYNTFGNNESMTKHYR